MRKLEKRQSVRGRSKGSRPAFTAEFAHGIIQDRFRGRPFGRASGERTRKTAGSGISFAEVRIGGDA